MKRLVLTLSLIGMACLSLSSVPRASYAENSRGVVIMINANDNAGTLGRILDFIVRTFTWAQRPGFVTRPRP